MVSVLLLVFGAIYIDVAANLKHFSFLTVGHLLFGAGCLLLAFCLV